MTPQRSPQPHPSESTDLAYRIRLLAILLTATLFSVMNASMVNVALPTLMRDFGIGIETSVWLYTGYTLPYAVSMPLFGVLGERLGPKTVCLGGVVAFMLASLLCSLAWSFPTLLLFRVLQALGAAAVIPNAMVIITAAFPPDQRGQALGIWSGVSVIGVGIGPALDGVLTQYVTWHSIFWVNAPFLLAVAAVGARVIRPVAPAGESRRFDLPGALLLMLALTALMLALTLGQTDGWTASETLALFVLGGIGMAGFLAWEFHIPDALLPIPLFRRRAYAAAVLTSFLQSMAMFGLLLLLPIYLQGARGHSPTEAGLLLLPMSAALVVVAPLAGYLSDRFGPRLPTTVGMALMAAGMLGFSRLTLTSSYTPLAALLILTGVGVALSISPVTSTAMNAASAAAPPASSTLCASWARSWAAPS